MSRPANNWGRASRFDFDNPSKWHTEHRVPLLDEHDMTNDAGKVIARVDRKALEEIARNNNKRVWRTGDPATLIVGHTSDDPKAGEKPAKGFVVNYQVLPFDKDPETGKVIYAIHGDYKVRPKNKHILEDFPRRSVELWWHRKEIDPVAVLGGTSPERDLGALARFARLNHVDLSAPATRTRDSNGRVHREPEFPIRFDRRGDYTIETYQFGYARDRAMSAHNAKKKGKGQGKVEKVMHEFKEGALHSGSKKGPKVTSRDQAVAIAMKEGGMARRNSRNGKPQQTFRSNPKRHAREEPEEYDRDDDTDDMDDDGDMDHDGGGMDNEGMTDHDMDGADQNDDRMDHDGMDDSQDDDNDPMIAKVMNSKWGRGLSEKLDMILQAVEGMSGQGGEGQMEPEGDEQGFEEMGQPGQGMQGQQGMDGMEGMEGQGDEGMDDEGADEQDMRGEHGQKPVKMGSTSMPGGMDTTIPGMGRKGKQNMNRNQRRRGGGPDPEVVRLQRRLDGVQIKYAKSEADKLVRELADEGILFGRNSHEHAENMEETAQYLAALLAEEKEDDVAYEVDLIRSRYARRKHNPANPAQVGVSRFARNSTGREGGDEGAEEEDDFEEKLDNQQTVQFADLQVGPQKMSRKDAIKFMRKKLGMRAS